MSDLTAFDPPPSPPPPSYEISQFEFDQKTSHILEQSAHDPPQRRVDEDGFEVWDEAVFEAALNGVGTLSVGQSSQSSSSDRRASSSSAIPPPPFSPASGSDSGSSYPPEKQRARLLPQDPAAGQTSGSGSGSASRSGSYTGSASSSSVPSSPPQQVRPLRVQKKPRPQKERPAWYAEAGLGGGSPPPSPLEAQPSGSSSRTAQAPLQRGPTVFGHAERERTPPPEFSPVGPSLDGPPYDSVVMTYEGEPPPPGPAAMGSPEPPAFSTPPPPATPTLSPPPPTVQPAPPAPPPSQISHTPLQPQARAAHRQPVHSQSLPERPVSSASSAPRPHPTHHQSFLFANTQPRPSSFYPVGQPNAPRVPFNPQMAYSKPLAPFSTHVEDTEPQVANPSSFYSNAVSAQYSFNVPARMRKQTLGGPPAQQEPCSSQQYPHTGMAAPSNGFGANSDKSGPPVASPRPNYGYSQATFNDNASIYSQTSGTTAANWGYGGQQGWPAAGGGYQNYR